MRVMMKTLECGPLGSFPAGSQREVTEEHGRQLVAGGYAVDITPKAAVDTADVVVTETAAVVADEIATIAPVETRKGRRNK